MPVPRPSYPMRPEGYFESEALAAGFPPDMARSMARMMGRVMDQQAIDERLNYQWITDNLSSGAGVTTAEYVIAAADSSDRAKSRADVICDGVHDSAIIQAVLNAVDDPPDSGWNGLVRLMAGQYNITTVLDVDGDTILQGSGRGTFLGGTGDVIECLGSDGAILDMSIQCGGRAIVGGAGNLHWFVSGIETGQQVVAGKAWVVERSILGALLFSSTAALASDLVLGTVAFGAVSDRNRLSNSTTEQPMTGTQVVMDGTDNAIDGCTFRDISAVDNTGFVVSILGTRNSFTNNMVHGFGPVNRPAYAVQIQAAATKARVRFNDLNAGAGGTWGTGNINDLGAGSLVGNNDL